MNHAIRLKHALAHYPRHQVVAAANAVLQHSLDRDVAETMARLVGAWVADEDAREPPPIGQAEVDAILKEARSRAN